jgi:hypothetical protein
MNEEDEEDAGVLICRHCFRSYDYTVKIFLQTGKASSPNPF